MEGTGRLTVREGNRTKNKLNYSKPMAKIVDTAIISIILWEGKEFKNTRNMRIYSDLKLTFMIIRDLEL